MYALVGWGDPSSEVTRQTSDINPTTHYTQTRVSLEKLTVAELVKKFPAS